MRVLVTGGAGYVGSHAVRALRESRHEPVVFDNLSEGHRQAVGDAPLIEGDLSDEEAVGSALDASGAEAVMHFAASAYVGESVQQPQKYYFNNVVNTLKLLRQMRERGIDRFVFSSSCTVYDAPEQGLITEDCPLAAASPYGRTKLTVEGILADYADAYGLSYASLRYFNAAGAAPDGTIGEDHEPETHLIPLVIFAAMGKRDSISIFGTDYPTPDGTCIRDYVHVMDLARAHIAAMEALGEPGGLVYNLSTGTGHSVREVIDTVGEVTGLDITVLEGQRRPGDRPMLVGSPAKIKEELGWAPQIPDLPGIVETAWRWHREHPDGFVE